LPDLAPTLFFLLPAMKRELVGLILFLDELKMNWERIIGTLTKDILPGLSRESESSVKNVVTLMVDMLKKS
jgi:hypothetical protein